MALLAKHASWRAIGVAAVACLLATGSSAAGLRPAVPAAASFACNQPFPAGRPGQVVLSGVGYGPYHAGQDPDYGAYPASSEIAADMPTLSAVTNYIRIYSSTGPAAEIVRAAQAAHMCVSLGISLGRNAAANAAEIAAGVRLARQSRAVRSVIVGSEVLLRGDLSVTQLIQDIRKVRAALGGTVAVSTADDFHQWLAHPELAREVDFVTVHIYPFWGNVPIGSAIQRLSDDYGLVARRFAGKPVVIGETGWPSAADTAFPGLAVPSPQNQARYFREFVTWAARYRVSYFYFDAFDEDWKTGERGVGTHWGLYQLNGNLKPALARWLPAASPATVKERGYRDVFVGSKLERPFDVGVDTDRQQRDWLTAAPGVLTMAYPAGHQWGAMVITAGPPSTPGHRRFIDLSRYRSFSVQLRARVNGERTRLGIKDWKQPDNGGEITVEETLTTHWSTVALPLSLFANVDRRHLYVVFELVFLGSAPETVDMRDLRYAPTSVPAPVFRPAQMPFPVYTDGSDPGNHFVPSGYMGDQQAVAVNQYWAGDPHGGKTCMQVTYRGAVSGGIGWAGVYWQSPVGNWGTVPGPTGYDLRRATRLTFWLRGTTGAERVQFLVGGITGRYGDSLQPAVKTPVLKLSTAWRQVTITLAGKNLTHIIGGFAWVASARDNPHGAVFYLDDIMYSA
jgi:exo-beta-1,3-glucanase (GH17 family)